MEENSSEVPYNLLLNQMKHHISEFIIVLYIVI